MIWIWPLWAQLVIGYVVVQRLAELIYANRNTRRLLAEGGTEYGAAHYPLFILLHGGWLVAIVIWTIPNAKPDNLLLSLFLLSQALRFWTLASIGRWWTTRIISAPHFPRVKHGPYRYFPHPNYAVVIMEIALLPLLFGSMGVAIIFTILNAALLWIRIQNENQILTERSRD